MLRSVALMLHLRIAETSSLIFPLETRYVPWCGLDGVLGLLSCRIQEVELDMNVAASGWSARPTTMLTVHNTLVYERGRERGRERERESERARERERERARARERDRASKRASKQAVRARNVCLTQLFAPAQTQNAVYMYACMYVIVYAYAKRRERLPIEEAEDCLCQLEEHCITVGVLGEAEAEDLADELGFTDAVLLTIYTHTYIY